MNDMKLLIVKLHLAFRNLEISPPTYSAADVFKRENFTFLEAAIEDVTARDQG